MKIKVMKLKNLFVTLGASLALGVGALAGAFAGEAKEVKATGGSETTHSFYIAVDTTKLGELSSPVVHVNIKMDTGDDTWRDRVASDLGDIETYSGYRTFAGTYSELWNGYKVFQIQLYDGTTFEEQVEIYNGTWGTDDYTNKIYFYGGTKGGTWETGYSPSLTQHTVTKLAVEFVDGVSQGAADWDLGSDSVYDGVVYPVPGGVTKNLEHFVGWFSDLACTVEYTASAITADKTLYAKYERLSVDSYFYWTDKDSTDLTNIYFFGEYAPVAWPGDSLADFKVSEVVNFHGEGSLYKIPVPSSGSFQFVMNNNNNVKTGDTSVVDKSFLYTFFNNEDSGIYWYGTSWNANSAAAAEVVSAIEYKRNEVTASGDIKDYSICGISADDAADLWEAYYDLTEDQQGLVDSSFTYTYKGDGSDDEDNIYFYDIVRELRDLAVSGGKTVSGGLPFIEMINSNGSAAIIVVASTIALTTFAVALILRKKRNSK